MKTDLFKDLAARTLPWYCNINVFANMNEESEETFMKNWEYVFIQGLGLERPLKDYLAARYIDGIPVDTIESYTGVKKSIIQAEIDSHLDTLLSPRSLVLFEHKYPMQPAKRSKYRYTGFYDNYANWHEPEYQTGNGYLNISLFDMFDNHYFQNFTKKNGIRCMNDLCTWIDDNAVSIQQKKAGIGKSTATLLLQNRYVANMISTTSLIILQQMNVK